MNEKVVMICSKCGKQFDMGWNGIYDGDDEIPTCDNCAQVKRTNEGAIESVRGEKFDMEDVR